MCECVIINYKAVQVQNLKKKITLTTMSFPAFSGLFATFIAAAAAAPDEIPTCVGKEKKKQRHFLRQSMVSIKLVQRMLARILDTVYCHDYISYVLCIVSVSQ